ncbi:MAG: winged helix-turn-helix transcriptional regulator [Clostridiales bacterium]|nr:winged helix-turn-helix transcriptional regulator [Clostridiales bacterium]
MPQITRDLNIIARCSYQFRTCLLSKHGISAAQAPYILHICSKPGMSQEQLANALNVNPSNATRQLSLLENQGYIKRVVSPHDKRIIELYPTEKGRQAAPVIKKVNQQWHDYLTQTFDPASLLSLENMLGKMRSLALEWNAKGAVSP